MIITEEIIQAAAKKIHEIAGDTSTSPVRDTEVRKQAV